MEIEIKPGQTIVVEAPTAIVNIAGTDIEIKKQPLREYTKLMVAFTRLPEIFSDLDLHHLDEKAVITRLPVLMEKAYPELLLFLSVMTGINSDFIDEYCGLDDISELILAVFKLNNFGKLKKNLEAIWSIAKQDSITKVVQAKIKSGK